MSTKYAFYTETAGTTGAVGSTELANGSVTEDKLATGAVTNAKIGADAINASKIADGAIEGSHISADAVVNGHIADNAIDSGQLQTDAVTTDKITNLNVTTAKLAANAVTPGKADLTATWNFTGPLQSDGSDVVTVGTNLIKAPCLYGTILNVQASPGTGEWGYSGGVLTAFDNGEFETPDTENNEPISSSLGDRVFVFVSPTGSPDGVEPHPAAGIYTITTLGDGSTPAVLTRATDADSGDEVVVGTFVFVLQGDALSGSYVLAQTSGTPTVLGTTVLRFENMSGGGSQDGGGEGDSELPVWDIAHQYVTGDTVVWAEHEWKFESGTISIGEEPGVGDWVDHGANGSPETWNVGGTYNNGDYVVWNGHAWHNEGGGSLPGEEPGETGGEAWVDVGTTFSSGGGGGGGSSYNADETTLTLGGTTFSVKNGGIGPTQLAVLSVMAANLGSDVAGNGLTNGGGGNPLSVQADATSNTITVGPSGIAVTGAGITSTELASNAVTSGKIATGAVGSGALAANSVSAGKLNSDVIGVNGGLALDGSNALKVKIGTTDGDNPLYVDGSAGTSVKAASVSQAGYMSSTDFSKLASMAKSVKFEDGVNTITAHTTDTQDFSFNLFNGEPSNALGINKTAIVEVTMIARSVQHNGSPDITKRAVRVLRAALAREGSGNSAFVGTQTLVDDFSDSSGIETVGFEIFTGTNGGDFFKCTGVNTWEIKYNIYVNYRILN